MIGFGRESRMPALQALDQDVYRWLQAQWQHGARTDPVMLDLTAMGSVTVLTLLVVFTTFLLLVMDRYFTAIYVVTAVLLGLVLSETTKHIVNRPRPPTPHPLLSYDTVRETSGSFPSGHSLNSAMIYLTLALVVAPHLRQRRLRRYVIGASVVLVVLIGISRMYLAAHFLSDVLGGWAMGFAWALTCRWVATRWPTLRCELASGA